MTDGRSLHEWRMFLEKVEQTLLDREHSCGLSGVDEGDLVMLRLGCPDVQWLALVVKRSMWGNYFWARLWIVGEGRFGDIDHSFSACAKVSLRDLPDTTQTEVMFWFMEQRTATGNWLGT